MSGCTGRARSGAKLSADPASPDMNSPREQIRRYEINLAAAARESTAKDQQLAELRHQVGELQRDLDAVWAQFNELHETRDRAAGQAAAFMREFCEAHSELAAYSRERQAIVLLSDLVFHPGGEAVRSEAQALLSALAAHLNHQSLEGLEVRITVHSDVKPLEESAVAQLRREAWERCGRRAMAIAGTLASTGVPLDRLTSVGEGDRDPVASNGTAEGRNANRRVEISLVPRESVVTERATLMTDVRD